MRTCFFLSVLLAATAALPAQKFALKIYAGVEWEKSAATTRLPNFFTIEESKRNLTFGEFSPALVFFKSNRDFHEVELSTIRFGVREEITIISNPVSSFAQPSLGEKETKFDLAIRYEHAVNLTGEDRKISPHLGFALQPYFQVSKAVPKTTQVFPTTLTAAGGRFCIVGRLVANLSERIFLDANIPFAFADLRWSKAKVQNPSLSFEEQATSQLSLDFVPRRFEARLGGGVKF